MKRNTKLQNYPALITDLASLIEQGRKAAVRYVNTALVSTYWLIGRRIVEYEQKVKARAEYGEALVRRLSDDLTKQFGKGWGEPHLRAVRQFYLIYGDIEKRYTLCSESGKPAETDIRHTPCSELPGKIQKKMHTLCAELTPISQTVSGIFEPLMREFPLSWSSLFAHTT